MSVHSGDGVQRLQVTGHQLQGTLRPPLQATHAKGFCTTKDSVWTAGDFIPLAKEKLCSKPGAAHSAPFQPSPYESVMLRVHVAPSATANGTLEVYGAPPLSVVPSEQLRLQITSFAYDPPEQAIAEEMVSAGENGGGEGDGGGDGGDSGGIGGGDGGDGGGGGGGGIGTSAATSSFARFIGGGGAGEGDGGGVEGDGGGGNGDGGGGEGSYEPAASHPPSHDASISSSAVRHTPRVRPWWAVRGRRRQAARQKLLAGLSWSVCRV